MKTTLAALALALGISSSASAALFTATITGTTEGFDYTGVFFDPITGFDEGFTAVLSLDDALASPVTAIAFTLNGETVIFPSANGGSFANANQPFNEVSYGYFEQSNVGTVFTENSFTATIVTTFGPATAFTPGMWTGTGPGGFLLSNFDSANPLDEIAVVGELNVQTLTIAAVGGNAGVPEPATWALMIGGFGVMGSALRRRRLAPGIR